jgi:photoactive yellow protein
MDTDGRVLAYNTAESRLSGLNAEHVLGEDFFVQVAPCTNNYLVAQKYVDNEELDEVMDYVFTFRMVPTSVRLRLIKRPTSAYQYLIVERA